MLNANGPESNLLIGGEIAANPWQLVDKESEVDTSTIATSDHVLLPLAQYLAHSEQLAGKKNIGVWLDSDESPEPLASLCQSIGLIAINFPVFSDGRGYSYARTLRDAYHYKGELRAIGDVLRDQLFFYQRCGFDSYLIRDDRDAESAADSLQDFSVCYQAGSDDVTPLIRRR